MTMRCQIFACACLLFGMLNSVMADNLLPGDTDCEREIKSMTTGPWTNHKEENPRLAWDQEAGYQSKSSLRVFNIGAIGMPGMTLPPGRYTFSCWARSNADSTRASLTMVKRDNNWHGLADDRAKAEILLSKDWKRYSHTFDSDGKTVLVPHFGVFSGEGWFDRFMINQGDEPEDWAPSSIPSGRLILPESACQVFDCEQPLPITIELTAYKMKNANTAAPLNVVVSNHFDEKIVQESAPVAFDNDGHFTYDLVIPPGKSGWYKITAGVDGLLSFRDAVVTVRPAKAPEKTTESCFVGLYGAQSYPEIYQKLGVSWLDIAMDWRQLEPEMKKYDFSSLEAIKKYKEQGFKIKLSIFTCPPRWLFSLNELETAKRLGTHPHRLIVTKQQSEVFWRRLAKEVFRRYASYVDIFEIGTEIDAMIGLADYNKSLEPSKAIANFAGGQTLDKVCHWIQVTAEEIRKVRRDAQIAAVRPSDVDARYKYAYSAAIFDRCGKYVNLFGIDCYPQPRWIGPTVPPTGTEQQLKQRFADARAAMEGRCAGNEVFISEYGYFVDVDEVFNPQYLMIQVNRMTRSFLQARLIGMKHLSYFHGGRVGLEGNRYHMGLQFGSVPLPALAAFSTMADTVNNVVECREIMLSPRLGGGVFRHTDGHASAALWSIPEGYFPKVRMEDSGWSFFDVMGNPLELKREENGHVEVPLTNLPIYIRGKDYSALCNALENATRIDDSPLDICFRPVSAKFMKVYLQNNSTEVLRGMLVHPGGERRFKLEPDEDARDIQLPAPPFGKESEYQLHIEGQEKVHTLTYKRETPLSAVKDTECQVDGSLETWKQVRPIQLSGFEKVMPLDHTTYSGHEDLSADIYIANDGNNLLISVDVLDDHIRKGDRLELGFDPLNNHIRPVDGSDPDDIFITVNLDGSFQVRGARSAELQEKCIVKAVRDDERKHILYQLSIPLSKLDSRLCTPGTIFGFNIAVCDDDSGASAGADYWLELRPGLLGSLRPDLFQEVIIE
jgi:hypothetical protein